MAEIFASAIPVVEPGATGVHLSWSGPPTCLHSPAGWTIERRPHQEDTPSACERIKIKSARTHPAVLIESPEPLGPDVSIRLFQNSAEQPSLTLVDKAASRMLVGAMRPPQAISGSSSFWTAAATGPCSPTARASFRRRPRSASNYEMTHDPWRSTPVTARSESSTTKSAVAPGTSPVHGKPSARAGLIDA